MPNFYFLYKSLGLIFPSHFVYDFSRKVFSMLCSINWPNIVVWLPLLLGIFGNMCVVITCFPVFHVTDFEINLAFVSSRFPTWSKNSGQNTAQKMKFSITDFFRWPDPLFPADLVTFTEEIRNGKLHFFVQWIKLLTWNKKAFFIIFKGFSLKQIKPTFLKPESPALKNVVRHMVN